MAVNAVPTKGNLIATKKSLELARVGYDLLDRKRNILVREMMTMMDRAATIQSENEARSMEQSLTLGWELLSELPREELDRVDNETLEKFYHAPESK